MSQLIKVYKATFRSYTNFSNDTVSREVTVNGEKRHEYVSTPNGYLLIPEYLISYYETFGDGFSLLTFAGYMETGERWKDTVMPKNEIRNWTDDFKSRLEHLSNEVVICERK